MLDNHMGLAQATEDDLLRTMNVVDYLSFLAFSASARNLDEFSTANFFLSSIRLCSDSPNGLLAIAFTAVNGIAENTRTPASSCHDALQTEADLGSRLRRRLGGARRAGSRRRGDARAKEEDGEDGETGDGSMAMEVRRRSMLRFDVAREGFC